MQISQAAKKVLEKQSNSPLLPTPTEPPQSGCLGAEQSVCPECEGKRFFRYEVPFGHQYFGKNFPCPSCNAEAVTYNSGLNQLERRVCLEDLVVAGRPGAGKMVNAAMQFITNGCHGFLTFHGGYGNGKSTAMIAMVNECLKRKIDAKYITMTEVMVYAREAFESEKVGDTDYGRISKLAGVHVLFIDEIDKARVTDYAREVQTHLFDVRYRNADRLGTVVAWNGGFDALDLPWVRSRLSEYMVVENLDADMRPMLGGRR